MGTLIFHFRSRIKKQRDLEKQRAFDDRHWSKKSLEEMCERDWRILREDFTISTKGRTLLSLLFFPLKLDNRAIAQGAPHVLQVDNRNPSDNNQSSV